MGIVRDISSKTQPDRQPDLPLNPMPTVDIKGSMACGYTEAQYT